ncbi:MAG: DUF1289 domain-containing protein [Rhizobacter sp.]|nr:DUF1289 domain-containing protein [Rhizobacter sp.]
MNDASVPSPCINVCRMDERTGWCEGCQRTLTEIAAWSTLDDGARREVWKLLPQRRAVLLRHQQGAE